MKTERPSEKTEPPPIARYRTSIARGGFMQVQQRTRDDRPGGEFVGGDIARGRSQAGREQLLSCRFVLRVIAPSIREQTHQHRLFGVVGRSRRGEAEREGDARLVGTAAFF